LFDDIRVELLTNPELHTLYEEVAAGTRSELWAITNGLINVAGHIYLSLSSPCVQQVLAAVHRVGHEDIEKTLHQLWHDFHLPGAHTVVRDFVRACVVCQRNKGEQLHPGDLLQPLDTPLVVWAGIAMDFIEGFPWVNDKSVILTVVDCFSKYAHFVLLGHPYTTTSIACTTFDEVVCLRGMPKSIISDRDPVFTSKFWQELFHLTDVKFHLSSAFHPQSYG
jgi:hypothetical protein